MDKKITRRLFLKQTGLTAAACMGVGTLNVSKATQVDAAYRQKVNENIRRAQRCAKMCGAYGRMPSTTIVELNNKTRLVSKLDLNLNESSISQIATAVKKAYRTHGNEIKHVYVL